MPPIVERLAPPPKAESDEDTSSSKTDSYDNNDTSKIDAIGSLQNAVQELIDELNELKNEKTNMESGFSELINRIERGST